MDELVPSERDSGAPEPPSAEEHVPAGKVIPISEHQLVPNRGPGPFILLVLFIMFTCYQLLKTQ